MLQNYNKILTKRTVILNYTRIKPRSRLPQKKIRIFYAPRFFSGQNRKKSVQITRANTVIQRMRIECWIPKAKNTNSEHIS